MFTSSIKHEFRYFHFVVVQKQGKKCTKKCDALAKLLFCLLNPLSFLRSRCLPRHWILKSLLSPTTNCPCECDSKSKSVNKLPNTRVFIAAEKWMVRSTGVGDLLSLQNGNLRCYTLLCEDLFQKRETNTK